MQKDFAINDALVNNLVTQFQNGDTAAFDALYHTVESFVRRQARKAEAAHGIPAAEFESSFFEWVWRCAETWDARTNFMQRLVAVMELRVIDLVRTYTAKKNNGVNYRALSLDRPVEQADANAPSFKDLVPDEGAEILPALIEQELRGDAALVMRRFQERNARYAAAVYCKLVDDMDGDALAKQLGFQSYDQNARKLVSRAVDAFRKFACEQLSVA